MHWFSKYITFSFTVMLGLHVHAFLDSPAVLPKGINSISIVTGQMRGLGQRFNRAGTLGTLSDHKSIEFDVETLEGLDDEVNDLVSALNQFGHYNIGNSLHMGQLKLDVDPEVDFHSFVYAHGITKKWTLGFMVPYVAYKNKIKMSHVGSNIPQIKKQLGGISGQLDSGFERLSQNAVVAVNDLTKEKGYEPLSDRDEEFFGDAQLMSMYNFYSNPRWSIVYKTILTLPTGPKDNPNDLMDLSGFGEKSIDQGIVAERSLSKGYKVTGALGYKWAIKDDMQVRVPFNASDALPNEDQLETVSKNPGDSIYLSMSSSKKVTSRFGVGLGFQYNYKFKDVYSGDSYLGYSTLSNDSEVETQKIDLEISYNTVDDYFKNKAFIPFALWLSVSDTFAGINAERQKVYGLWGMMFF